MQIQLLRLASVLLLLVLAFGTIGVIAVDDAKQLDGPAQFDAEKPSETTIPHNQTTVEQALRNTTTDETDPPHESTVDQEETRDCSALSQNRDSDNDFVNNFLECENGLDETSVDTDGDTLTDAEELLSVTKGGAPIPESNPREMDIYLIIGLSDGAYIDTDEIVSLFNGFDIHNPNGEQGITLHYETRWVNETAQSGNYREHRNNYRTNLTGETDVYRGLLITSGENDAYLGRASIYLNFAVAESGREETAAHEILHLVVGRIPENNCEDPYHNCHGKTILSPQVNENNQLSHNTTVHIEQTGLGPQRDTRFPDPIPQCDSLKSPVPSCTNAEGRHHQSEYLDPE